MLRDSSEFKTIVSTGTNPLDRLYKASKRKELEKKQNLSFEGIGSTKESYEEPLHHSSEEPPRDSSEFRIYRAAKGQLISKANFKVFI